MVYSGWEWFIVGRNGLQRAEMGYDGKSLNPLTALACFCIYRQ